MSDKTISTKKFLNVIRRLYWDTYLTHWKYINQLHQDHDAEVQEQQRFQQERIAMHDFSTSFPDAFADLYYLESLIKYNAVQEMPEPDEFELGSSKTVKVNTILTRLRKEYWDALVAKRAWEDEPGGHTFLNDNHNYDYRLDGFRKIFHAYGLDKYYSDLDALILKVHYKFELDSMGCNTYIQFDPLTEKRVEKPILPKRIEVE